MIDQGLPPAWPAEVFAALGAFSQGDLVERPPFFYVASSRYGIWELTRDFGEVSLSDEIFELDSDFRPPYGLITTETCDLVEEDRKNFAGQQPWFSVAPVYDLTGIIGPERLDLLDSGRLAFFRRIKGDPPGDGIWAVDARIECPIEKSWLVGRTPIQVLRTAEERSEIAEFLANRRNRPVLSSQLHSALIRSLRRWIERMKPERRSEVMAGIEEVRVIVAGDPLDPDGAGLIIVLTDEAKASIIRDVWDAKWEAFRAKCEEVGISLIPNAYETYDTLSARKYRQSFRVPLEF